MTDRIVSRAEDQTCGERLCLNGFTAWVWDMD